MTGVARENKFVIFLEGTQIQRCGGAQTSEISKVLALCVVALGMGVVITSPICYSATLLWPILAIDRLDQILSQSKFAGISRVLKSFLKCDTHPYHCSSQRPSQCLPRQLPNSHFPAGPVVMIRGQLLVGIAVTGNMARPLVR